MKWLVLVFGLFLSMAASANTTDCYLTVVKDSCWVNYEVKVYAVDNKSKKTIATVTAEKDQQWGRQKFQCQLGSTFIFSAVFNPVFWESDEGKDYKSTKYWIVPTVLKPEQAAIAYRLCFPQDFRELPLPPDATAKCHCDPSVAPALKLN